MVQLTRVTGRIFLKLIVAVLSILILALTAVNYLASQVAHRTYVSMLRNELADKGRMLAMNPSTLHGDDRATLQELEKATGARITRIDREGRVIADSGADASHMENHGHRAEVAAALAGRVGSDTRTSATVGVNFLYVAVPLADGALRLAVPLRQVESQVRDITRQLLTSVALAFIPAVVLAAFFARYASRNLAGIINHAGRLARGEFDSRLPVQRHDEFGILAEQLNVTGEKLQKMVDELENEHQKLEHLERVRKDFVINVSHELRTPVACIQGYTETLLDGALHDQDHNIRFLTIIRQNAERLGRLIADLMTLSQVELKRTKFQFASYEVNGMLGHAVDSMAPMAQRKSIAITLECAPEGTEAYCDPEAVHQILTNLLENAVKYTPENGSITVGSLVDPTAPDHIEILVRDTGIGIPESELPRLFERFYRVDKARSREMGGTGLGLAIVKHLVQSQGGEVRVSSRANEGSTFSFTLPRNAGEPALLAVNETVIRL